MQANAPIRPLVIASLLVVLGAAPALAQKKGASSDRSNGLKIRTWTVDGVKRLAQVHIPPDAETKPSALVFAFHGHGGTGQAAADQFAIHKHWPSAIVVYPRGLPTPASNDPEAKKTGWQYHAGEQGDRDLHFFDTVLADLSAQLKVNEKRVFVAGFSNGGGFAYVLWRKREDKIAATAVVAMSASDKALATLKPKPFLLVAGKKDPLQKFSSLEHVAKTVAKQNECEEGKPWNQPGCTLYLSPNANPVVFMHHGGGHEVPHAAQAAIVSFFRNAPK
jgi:polyhydroxybutyrate depolymerase